MRSSKIISIAFILLSILMFTSQLATVQSSTTADYSSLNTNRLILNQPDLTFNTNQTFTVFLLLQNNGQDVVYNLFFNYTIEPSLFSIVSSSNKTSTSHDFVYNNFNKLVPGQTVTFNMTLKVVSNTTETGVLINQMELHYEYSEFHLTGLTLTPSLTININGPNTGPIYPSVVTGTNELNSTVLGVIVLFPIIVAFILSFIFGRRRNR